MAGILNPYDMIRDAQGFVSHNWYILAILVVLIGIVSAFMLNKIYEMYMEIPPKERTFRRGRTSFASSLRVELLDRIKRKRRI